MSCHAGASGIEDNAAANRDAQESAGEHDLFQLAGSGMASTVARVCSKLALTPNEIILR